jgi:hypothetical protein
MTSLDDKRWAQRAHQLQFEQLPALRAQAEKWRAGLAALTTLLTAALLVKGRDTVDGLVPWASWLVVAVLAVAFAALVAGTLFAVSAAGGRPGQTVQLTDVDLRAWTDQEVRRVGRAIQRATWLVAGGVALVAVVVGLTWLAPAPAPAAGPDLVSVTTSSGTACGQLLGADSGTLVLQQGIGVKSIPLDDVRRISPATQC